MHPDYNLILIKEQDKTTEIKSWGYDRHKPVVYVNFTNGKSYPYNKGDVHFYKDPKIVEARNLIILKEESPLTNVKKLLYFGPYCKIVYQNGYRELTLCTNIRIVDSALHIPKSKNCFDYLKQIAVNIGLTVDNRNILASQYEKLNFIREDSVMADFLAGKLYSHHMPQKSHTAIYPFGFNLSQKKAVDAAMEGRLSIIEGPPGTGKTQTILNIIANAVMKGESVAVVSSNNSAIANVYEKLKKYELDFIAAFLGSKENKENFVAFQKAELPDISKWKSKHFELAAIRKDGQELEKMLLTQNELSRCIAETDAVEKEYLHFKDFYNTLNLEDGNPVFGKRVSTNKILDFMAEYELLISVKETLSFFQKIRLLCIYGLRDLRFYGQSTEKIIPYCQYIYYERKLVELKKLRAALERELDCFNFENKMDAYTKLSMCAFKDSLVKKYSASHYRRQYTLESLKTNSNNFIVDYPVILSTTYSLCSCLSQDIMYDYVIMDEASQVDIATGILALSCAKKAVIVGDLKQLPNVVDNNQKALTDQIFEKYGLSEEYRYSDHSMLSLTTELFPNVSRVLLKEHYRCHPEIIGFCNQRFYNGELVVLTKADSAKEPLMVYRTAKGNHARKHVNMRQIDVISKEIFPSLNLSKEDGSVGIVTPYRDQANALQNEFKNTAVKADTADKFQGQEKSVMIFSTVDNEIGEFASNPNRLNVAVSRAVDQFIVVTDGNDNDKTSPIHELIGYIQYHNHEVVDSHIRSVFDYLYSQYANSRAKTMQKYGRISDYESENIMYNLIKNVLSCDEFSKYGVSVHVPLRMILNDYSKLTSEEIVFASNHLTHVDFLVFSRLTHKPVLVVEVDGFSYHNNEKQQGRDKLKNSILQKYEIPIVRFSTVGSGEKEKFVTALKNIELE